MARSSASWLFLLITMGVAPIAAQDSSPEVNPLELVEKAVIAAVAKAEPSVCAIARVRRDEIAPVPRETLRLSIEGLGNGDTSPTSRDFIPHDFCSGVVVDKRGLILTVLSGLGEISRSDYYVWIQRRPYPAKLKAADPWLNVAVLEIQADDLLPIEFGDTKSLKRGQFVIGLGNSFGAGRDGQLSTSWGLISNLAREAPPNANSKARGGRETLHHYGTLIQTDRASSDGNCGGALLNFKGELIGLTTTWTGTPLQEEAAGFAIPVDEEFRNSLETLKAGKLPDYGFLGIAPRPLPLIERQKGRIGVLVDDVVPGTPAAKAGIKPGDSITHVGDHPIIDDIDLIRSVSARHADSTVDIHLVRDMQPRTTMVSAVLSKKLPEQGRESFAENAPPAWRGLKVEYTTAVSAFREFSRQVDPEGSIAVLDVARDSLAWKAGLRVGQFISHVENVRVNSPREFASAVHDRSGAITVRLTYSPDGKFTRVIAAE